MAIIFVSGINDQSKIGVTLDDNGKMVNLVDGNCSVHGRIPLKQGVSAYYTLFGKGVKQKGVDLPKQPSMIFNQISDPDTHRGSLHLLSFAGGRLKTLAVIESPAEIRGAVSSADLDMNGRPDIVFGLGGSQLAIILR